MVEQSLREVHEELPTGFYEELPELRTGPLQGFPRVYDVALGLLSLSRGPLEIEQIRELTQLYQQVTPLKIGELWALPAMLRVAVLELLSQSLARITGVGRKNPLPPISVPPANDAEIVAYCIISIQTLAIADWPLFFEGVSRVEQVLRVDPARVYPHMDRETRDRYRKVVEEIARVTGQDEESVAGAAIQLAESHAENRSAQNGDSVREMHVGYYLLDEGRVELESLVKYQASLSESGRRWVLKHPTFVYLGSVALPALLILVAGISYATHAGGHLLQAWGTALLLVIPALTASVSIVNWAVTLIVPPRILPKMDFRDGIPPECKTLVVIPSLLTDAAEVRSLLRQLELHFVRNPDPNLHFALLTDLTDSPRKHGPEASRLVEQAATGILALNEKYPRTTSGPFYLFHRDPKWNPQEERWMGWERKRGKLHQLNLLLRGGAASAFSVQTGNPEVLQDIRYVITVDSDTVMPRDAAERLVASLAHPLNRALRDAHSGAVKAGYSVLQPRVEVSAASANLSRFTRVFAGDIGLDLYTRAVSDVYQDLFGEGIYVGKGIYDVDAFERSLAGRMPENALLSHDLLEGLMGRVGLVTDVVFYEDYPPHYFVYVRRSRRWIRGDWQLLPWLLPRVPSTGKGTLPNNLSIIDRWKILDNLRRSLLEPGLLALLLAGWLWLPGSSWGWTAAALLIPAVPVVTGLLVGSLQALKGGHWRGVLHGFQNGVLRWLLALVFLLYETLLTLGGIMTTLVRLFITRKRLLQWTTYADTVRLFAGGVTWRQILLTVSAALALGSAVAWLHPPALPAAAPILGAWLLSPGIAYWISRPLRYARESITFGDRERLRRLARRTWLFFEQFVGPEDHWLPPDHFQEAPRGIVAHSTSPTDLGLMLLSTLAAYDFGYIAASDLSARLQSTFETLQRLEMYQGHFLNWYDTRTLEPLLPRYVSTVDSGNLAGCLVTLRQACEAMPTQPVVRWENWEGLLDILGLLEETIGKLQPAESSRGIVQLSALVARVREEVLSTRGNPGAWARLLRQLETGVREELNRLLMSLTDPKNSAYVPARLHELSQVVDRIQNQLYGLQREIDQLSPWLPLMDQSPALFSHPGLSSPVMLAWSAFRDVLPPAPSLGEIGEICEVATTRLVQVQDQLDKEDQGREEVYAAQEWCRTMAKKLSSAADAADELLISYQHVRAFCEQYLEGMDFRFLFSHQRKLFHIGYNVTAGQLDRNYYDLLASEASITSLVTIGEAQIPQSHWLHLGRPVTEIDGTRALLSWGGTMFEYLMPALLIRGYPGTFLQDSRLAAVEAQIRYGRQKKVPWGVSESGYYAFDANLNYQYRSFGVPRLGLKRGLDADLVVAPYASLLALPLRPRRVLQNLDQFARAHMLSAYGLYEAMDFSPARLPPGQTHAIVRSFMAHHQGMILLSLLNYLKDDIMVRRFHADPRVRSVELLLQERIPDEAAVQAPRPTDGHVASRKAAPSRNMAVPWKVPAQSPSPQVHFLSNGRYGLLITSAGAGYSRWQAEEGTAAIDLTRWRADSTREDWGSWVYLQDLDTGDLWSAAYQPTTAPAENENVQFYPHMAEFRRSDHGIGMTMEITVAPEDDVEIRRVSVTNHTDRLRRIALTSYAEVILTQQTVDAGHPAFSKLFIESEFVSSLNALLFWRRPRLKDEEPAYLVHTTSPSSGMTGTAAFEADRAQFLGRGRTPRDPIALRADRAGLTGTTGATLDPIMALRHELELPPHASAQISFITGAAHSRDEALELADRYRGGHTIIRTFELARARAEAEMRQLDLTSADIEQAQRLLSALLYPASALRADPATLQANRKGQAGLWPFSISGDYPILLVRLEKSADLSLIRSVLQAHRYWRNRNIPVDLVVLNQQGATYTQEMQARLQRLLVEQNSENWLKRRGGIFILYADQLSDSDRTLLETAARAILDGTRGSFAEQVEGTSKEIVPLPPMIPSVSGANAEPTPPLDRPGDLLFDNGLGGFSADGREYVIYLEPGQRTPAPWINVIANPDFGFTVSESGSGYSWSINSHENRLTPWTNDPVTDAAGEAIYLRDEETAEVWSPAPLPCGAPEPYVVRHGAGYTTFTHSSHGLRQHLTFFAVMNAPVKIMRLRLENTWSRPRRITATFYAEWVLGLDRQTTQQYVLSEFNPDHQALLACNAYNSEFAGRVAFAAASKDLHGLTADRKEFLGRFGDLAHPAALERVGLATGVEPGMDPCAALQVHVDLEPGGADEVCFLLGQGSDRAHALQLVKQYRATDQAEQAWKRVTEHWDDVLGAVQVSTPDPAMDILLNRWLLYPALSCRIWGRTALYQSSGAFGFRDQLQDVMALIHAGPTIAREQILEAAQHQFEAGDVLHWWHPPYGRGVRT
ncbi:MAG: GH36-type glycosyl hydrolase domain-containing protein, partial [Anaerolineae bacterium]